MKRYPAYKDCGIDWLGEIPEHWVVKELKYLSVNERYSFVDGPFGSDLKNEEYTDTGVPLIQLNNIGIGEHIIRNLKFISKEKAEQLYKHKVLPNDIVIAKMAEPVARSAKVKPDFKEYVVVADCMKFRPALDTINVDFLVYTMNGGYVKAQAEVRSTGTTRIRIGLTDAKKLKVVVPPLPEQHIIANYLDRKAHQIDTFIEKKQKLIDLLKEQRVAIINQAVTKGLNPNVKLKDSGIEWLGEIPEHWEVKKLKHVITIKSGEGITREDINEEGTYEVYGGNGFLGFTEDYNVTNDTLIIGRVGAKCGNVHLVCDHKWVTDNALIAKTNQNYRFLFFLLTSMRLNNLANQNAQPLITGTTIKYQIAALPSIDEQDKIVENIESETMRFDTLLRNNQRQIDHLQEYRTALISEVVTGKIDVRDYGEQEVISS